MMTFSETGLESRLLRALDDKGYKIPTPIQQQAIPLILSGKDILGCAQTGTGKTAAFSLPIIQRLTKHKSNRPHSGKIRTLILTPTRELAIQIEENIAAYNKYVPLRHTVIYGGVKQGVQVSTLKKGIDILVATPGRLLDLINQGYISLSAIEIFVLDEADRMLDMGFINDIKKVIRMLPVKRQSLFFSATMPDNIIALSKEILSNPIKIEVTPEATTAETVYQELIYTNKDLKKELLLHVLEKRDIDQALVFTRTKHRADKIARDLRKQNISSEAIHGDKAQNKRQRVLNQFKDGKIRVLVATDIAARGIDIDKLKHVINYEIPNEPESYVHRIGRSGRAGEEGVAISFAEPEENVYVKEIEKLINQKLNVINDHPFPQTDKPMTEAEKKEWRKEKDRKKQTFFANRKKNVDKKRNKRKSTTNSKSKSNGQGPHENDGSKKYKPRSSDKNRPQARKKPTSKTRNQTDSYRDRLKWPLD